MSPALAKVVAEEAEARAASVWLVAKRPPISHLPFFWRRLARIVYEKFHWCPDYGIEYQGVFTDEAEARYEASRAGGFYMELPLNGALPDKACQYGKHDFPLSEASAEYRKRRPAFVAVRRETAENILALEGKLEELEQSIQGQCVA